MRALKYEGTPVEIALGLKQDGNESARLKRWKEAKELFTQALGVLRKSHQTSTSAELNETSDAAQGKAQEEKSIEEACYVNRALCNLELSMILLPLDSMTSTIILTSLRKLSLHNHRLRRHPSPQPNQHQSILPIRTRPPCSRQAQRSPRR